MKGNMTLATDRRSIKEIYDQRYRGDYMLADPFTRWSHHRIELKRVTDTLRSVPADGIRSILDYGCGQGGWTEHLSRIFPGAKVAGIEISGEAVGKARARMPGFEFHEFDGDRAPMEDSSFDLVFSYHVLEHVLDIEATVRDMSRLVREGGYLCAILPCGNAGSFEERLTRLMKDGKERSATGSVRFYFEDPAHIRRMESAELIGLFRKERLAVTTEYYAHQFFGAIDWITRFGSASCAGIFDLRRADGLGAKAWLLMMSPIRAIALANRLSSVDRSVERTPLKRAVLTLLLPLRFVGKLLARATERLAALEWDHRRKSKNGSAQFLVFRKPGS